MAGVRQQPTAEERAAIVAAYLRTGHTERTIEASGTRWGSHVVRRVLREEGVAKPARKRPPDDELRRLWDGPWRQGAPKTELARMIGVPSMAGADIEKIMAGIPRPAMVAQRGPRAPAVALSTDPMAWAWVAGVFDAKGAVTREQGRVTLGVGCGTERALAQALVAATGAGRVARRGTARGTYARWVCDRAADVPRVAARLLPYLKTRRTIVARLAGADDDESAATA